MANFYPLIFVIHETNVDIETALMLQNDPEFLASYHAIVDRTGTIHRLVPPEAKAYAARQSSFIDPVTGEEQQMGGSVDDFAYHVALESPPDGIKFRSRAHSGYTFQQYKSLAWLSRDTGVEQHRIATHGQVRTPRTTEPRCFNQGVFQEYREKLTNEKTIDFGVLDLQNG